MAHNALVCIQYPIRNSDIAILSGESSYCHEAELHHMPDLIANHEAHGAAIQALLSQGAQKNFYRVKLKTSLPM